MTDTTIERSTTELLQLASFKLGNEEYAVDISAIQEIVRMTGITRVPRSPSFMEGVINLRGKVIPVIDLRKRFGKPAAETTKATRIIIVQVAHRTVGLLVDAVSEVLRLESTSIAATPELVAQGVDANLFKGVGQIGDRLIILLDLQRLLSGDEVAAIDMAHL